MISVKRRVDDECLQFQLLSTLEFTSKRKRMSVIVRDLQTGKIRLICKGADSVVKERLDLSDRQANEYMQQTEGLVDSYADVGLRTLFPVSYTHLTLPTNREV